MEFFDDVPAVHLLFEGGKLLTLKRWDAATTWDTQALVARSEITTAILALRGAMFRTGGLTSKRRNERFRRNSQGTNLWALEPGRDLI